MGGAQDGRSLISSGLEGADGVKQIKCFRKTYQSLILRVSDITTRVARDPIRVLIKVWVMRQFRESARTVFVWQASGTQGSYLMEGAGLPERRSSQKTVKNALATFFSLALSLLSVSRTQEFRFNAASNVKGLKPGSWRDDVRSSRRHLRLQ
ncbi:uncharacterized protein PHALS_00866 [Plasmopara halstedii]|uniref:Uncharacterized protein n=1 Tax=Plasmopara halstedii TaxID=4781 RepID=A0A0N7L6K2_PLAHL|nr:uncharacterized protein PHALS_00866 [Plasmopara halstedii]CEG44507.1 hypothetical protein PHALS_00866 [Plasmopara halstedii]|eukprot:XP_024580876.1 hypothetical protein PHALS_00866 [Plasmopara halstedii]